jgi:hypothetical protein
VLWSLGRASSSRNFWQELEAVMRFGLRQGCGSENLKTVLVLIFFLNTVSSSGSNTLKSNWYK